MNSGIRWGIVGIVVLVVLGIYFVNRNPEQRTALTQQRPIIKAETATVDTAVTSAHPQDSPENSTDLYSAGLPRMLELGSVGCRPCQLMAPIIEELKTEYAGRLSVEFYDVRKDPAPGRHYGIRVIPTQIFLDAQGNEVFRHEGFFPKEQILSILAQMGVAE